MAYRNGTYVAFDGGGDTDPITGDIKYYNLMKSWASSKQMNFVFSNSHLKTNQVRDTLRRALSTRMRNSKNFLIILTEETKIFNSNLNWEIVKAHENDLPFIVVYPEYKKIQNPIKLSSLWPIELEKLISEKAIKAIHIPFKLDPISDAISQFSVVSNKYPNSSLSYYSNEAYESWGLK